MKNGGYAYPDRIRPEDQGLTVIAFYSLRYPRFSETVWLERIGRGLVLLNDRPAGAGARLAAGDRLVYMRPPWDEPDVRTDFGTLLEDADVLALDKPSGLPVLPGGMFLENTLLRLVRRRCGDAASPVHRLGRGTSGVILFSRNCHAAAALASAMSGRRILKVYLALASGTAMPNAFTVDAPIGPVPYTSPVTVNAFSPAGRPSESHVRVLRRMPERDASLVEVTIPTGRPHQIRIHLAHAGFPLVGDPLYGPGGLPRAGGRGDGEGEDEGEAARPGETGYLLHSWRIRFPHPATGAETEVVSPPPATLDPGAFDREG